MWWEKKPQSVAPKTLSSTQPSPIRPKQDSPMMETIPKPSPLTATNQNQSFLGRSVVLRGELTGKEDLLIGGQFEGNINLETNCLTVAPQGQVKAEIHARHVVIHGSVNGNISAREKIEIRRTGHVVGDLLAAAIAIEEGAYFKGSIDILREEPQAVPRAPSVPAGSASSS